MDSSSMAKQLFSAKKSQSDRDLCVASQHKKGREITTDGLMRERFYRPDFHYQDSGAYLERYSFIKGYN